MIPWLYKKKCYIIECCYCKISINNILEDECYCNLKMDPEGNHWCSYIYIMIIIYVKVIIIINV